MLIKRPKVGITAFLFTGSVTTFRHARHLFSKSLLPTSVQRYQLPPFVVKSFQRLQSGSLRPNAGSSSSSSTTTAAAAAAGTASAAAVAAAVGSAESTITMQMLIAATATAAAAMSASHETVHCQESSADVHVVEGGETGDITHRVTHRVPRTTDTATTTADFSGKWCLDHSTSDKVWGMMRSLGAPAYMGPFADIGKLTYVVVHSPKESLWVETCKLALNYLPQFTRENIFHLDGREVKKLMDGGSTVTMRAFVQDGLVVTEAEHHQYGAAQRIERFLTNGAKEYRVRNIVSFRNKDGTGITTNVYRRNFVREEDYVDAR